MSGVKRLDRLLADRGAAEGAAHGVQQAFGLFLGGAPVGDQVARDLGEDALAPSRVIQFGLSDTQQCVSQRQRVEHA